MKLPLTFEHSDKVPENPQQLVNAMAEIDPSGSGNEYIIKHTPGLLLFKDTSDAGENRGGYVTKDDHSIVTVIGATIYHITSAGVQTNVGTMSTSTGDISIIENPTQILIVDGTTTGYVITKSTLALATVTLPFAGSHADFQDTYALVVRPSTGVFFISDVNDFTTWSALDFTTAEASPDNLVAIVSDHQDVWALGTETSEIYYNSGAAFPFVRRQGAIVETGCAAAQSVAKAENSIFWLDDHGMVRNVVGYRAQIISTPNVNHLISARDISTAKGFAYAQDGHIFYLLMFSDLCLAYDVTTQKWHKRSGFNAAWRAAWVAGRGSVVYAGDSTNGIIYKLDTSTYTDNATTLKRIITTVPIESNRRWIRHNAVEFEIRTGDGDYDVGISYSDDRGRTWSGEKIKSIGPIGEYTIRIRATRLGRSRHRIYRLTCTDATQLTVIRATLDATINGKHVELFGGGK